MRIEAVQVHVVEDEGIQQGQAGAHAFLGFRGQVRAIGVFPIVEVARAREGTGVFFVVDAQLAGDLERVREQVVLVVVQVAVVRIHREATRRIDLIGDRRGRDQRIEVGEADQLRIALLHAHRSAVGEIGVDRAAPVAGTEFDRLGRSRERADERQRDRGSQRATARVLGIEVGHECSPLLRRLTGS